MILGSAARDHSVVSDKFMVAGVSKPEFIIRENSFPNQLLRTGLRWYHATCAAPVCSNHVYLMNICPLDFLSKSLTLTQ